MVDITILRVINVAVWLKGDCYSLGGMGGHYRVDMRARMLVCGVCVCEFVCVLWAHDD